MVLILKSCGSRKPVLADIVDEVRSVGINGIELKYAEKKESLADFERTLGNLLYLNPFSTRNIDQFIGEMSDELICVRSYTSPEGSGDWYDSSGRGFGRVKNECFLRRYNGISQSWKVRHVDVSQEYSCRGEDIPIIHSLLSVLERFKPTGVREAQIWLETGRRIRNGFYLSGLKKEFVISHFEGWENFIGGLSKNNDNSPKEGDFYKGVYFIEKEFPNGLHEYCEPVNISGQYRLLCAIDEYPSFYRDTSEKRTPSNDSFLWAVDKLKTISEAYEKITGEHRKMIRQVVNNLSTK